MRVINPAAPASPVTAQDKTDLQAALAAALAKGNAAPTFDELRAELAAGKRGRFTDGHLCQAALDLGLKVEP